MQAESFDIPSITPAEEVSITAFLNSYAREWDEWTISDLPESMALASACREGMVVTDASIELWAPLRHRSVLGRHSFGAPLFRIQKANGAASAIDFAEFVQSALAMPHLQRQSTSEGRKNFAERIDESRRYIEDVYASRGHELAEQARRSMTFIEGEQFLVHGHSFHPTPKSRDALSASHNRRYCPEFGARFSLHWFAVDSRYVHSRSARAFEQDWVKALFDSDPTPRIRDLPAGYTRYPLNPWQASFLLGLERIQALERDGALIDLGTWGDYWYPTSSVRSLYRPSAPYMLKTSLSVRLTNSVRNLLPHEVERGLQVHEVMASASGHEFRTRFPHVTIVTEPAYYAILNEDGTLLPESIIVCRQNPIDPARESIVLASLTQESGAEPSSLIARHLRSLSKLRSVSLQAAGRLWFDAYCKVVLQPLLLAHADYGFVFGAHQQNIVIGIEDHLPVHLYFRDCQGTGYTEKAFARLQGEVPTLNLENGNILSDGKIAVLLVYYLIINSSFNAISALSTGSGLPEEELLRAMRVHMKRLLEEGVAEPCCLEHLLGNPELFQKRNFLCALTDLNENTTDDPIALYRAIPNPFHETQGQQS
ncbi:MULTISPECIES: IucA/IucC family protein [unclassified Variovorax]|uniref:IucA/IucC family protein n=1 Tax=unclassified Variovorax TaxID=663243 RepID=UPI00076CA615|nr:MULTISPECIES: IucA/IucC family protein [unclassified Variovorax]KWT72601.1 Citrate:6-N-acetyl-6-N-hydroxy-L-lysine ligase, alpha subunit, aerobactin biosynthesis protein IucA [Variovorax sp. WDL1]PNG58414.1 N(2)-citryl-N(6)-acetyl-N(6)-hydroxylysine synthase [Variovorax sp. B4]PNG61796.1 N(2)-citryl-N(6)-acetyl-N(6)-hydroxylysine synthase [Variovorax sp. B2]VTV12143.1 N(2)-citryl-N(6)-acetyl-N(6)-hydroxylysine synthase [Variovorax sp. WDL1]